MEPNLLETPPEEEKPKKTPGQIVLTVFEVSFWCLAIGIFLLMVYINTSDNLTVSPFLSPTLFLLFGVGIGGGMLFRTISHRKNNFSPINFLFKIGASILVLLSVTLSFLLSLMKLL